ncbi:hypothetical protein PRIPAC_81296 [Pristionchus pacificus]|uniref:Uncharacterized protein n=1 Tax=Pristionchus pacificus TaxID=54126 RepID=A0A454XK29_PRIPA|nr:hypothetical protein PRIPAC_81296 [Pristionchus pacificus]|eukprot:PDM72955.1 hypothetical protein PRIPAC_39389 [Pristionchus pacificus]
MTSSIIVFVTVLVLLAVVSQVQSYYCYPCSGYNYNNGYNYNYYPSYNNGYGYNGYNYYGYGKK